jgi:streptogramin lyase
VLPERRVIAAVLVPAGIGIGIAGIQGADGTGWALAWLALFTAAAALVGAFSDLVPIQDGADGSRPAPRPPAGAGRLPRLTAGSWGSITLVVMAAVSASGGIDGNGLARLGGVVLGAGLAALAGAIWLAGWERRTGLMLLVEEIGTPGWRSRWRGLPPELAYCVLPRDPADWPEVWPADLAETEVPTRPEHPRRSRQPGPKGLAAIVAGLGGMIVLVLLAPPAYEDSALALTTCRGVEPLRAVAAGAPIRVPTDVAVEAATDGTLWGRAGESRPWPSTESSGTVFRIDRASGRVLSRTAVSFAPTQVVAHGGSIWVAGWGERRLLRLDPRDGRISGQIALEESVDLIEGEGALWAVDGRSIRRVEAAGSRLEPAIVTRRVTSTVVAGAGALWMLREDERALVRIDVRTGAITEIHLDLDYAHDLVVGLGSVWVMDLYDGIARVDARSLEVAETIPLGAFGYLVAGPDALWVSGSSGVARFDPRCNRPVKPLLSVPGLDVDTVARIGDTVWAVDGDGVTMAPLGEAGTP